MSSKGLFKSSWEKDPKEFLSKKEFEDIVSKVCNNKELLSCTELSGGLQNHNFLLKYKNTPALILRIYRKGSTSARKEIALDKLLKGNLPLAHFFTFGKEKERYYSLMEWREGTTLRDYIVSKGIEKALPLVQEAGKLLANLKAHSYPKAGFLNENLHVSEEFSVEELFLLTQEWLHKDICKKALPVVLHHSLLKSFEKAFLNISFSPSQLVHGDFDPGNILVVEKKGKKFISAILDWEFAHAGSAMLDISNMLRYAHLISPLFKTSFIQAFKDAGGHVKEPLDLYSSFFNLLSLIECLQRSSITQKRKIQDILSLIQHHEKNLRTFL